MMLRSRSKSWFGSFHIPLTLTLYGLFTTYILLLCKQKCDIECDSGSSIHYKLLEDQILSVKYENEVLKKMLEKRQAKDSAIVRPSLEYETQRRRIRNQVKEIGYYVRYELEILMTSLSANQSETSKQIEILIVNFIDRQLTLENEVIALASVDGFDSWRQKEERTLSQLIQQRFIKVQNPPDCSKAMKLVVDVNIMCGLGCQLHHIVGYFVMAYATGRTMILLSEDWIYNKGGWEEIFKPISNTCKDANGSSTDIWSATSTAQVINRNPVLANLGNQPDYLPLYIPEDIADRLKRLHGNPGLWWVGQLVGFLFKPQPHIKSLIMKEVEQIEKPYVSIIVRRSDKIRSNPGGVIPEASYHSLEEYMYYVEEYYHKQELAGSDLKRRVYVSSDDPNVIAEASRKYANYEVYGNDKAAKLADSEGDRYSLESLMMLLSDIYIQIEAEFVICTLSSNVCRLVHELRQLSTLDASEDLQSLDDLYYFHSSYRNIQRARYPHLARSQDEISFLKEDKIHIMGNHYDGYSKGKNMETKKVGLYPSYKVEQSAHSRKIGDYE